MEPQTHILKNGYVLLICEALVEDAPQILKFVHKISAESDFLTFGPGEFNVNEQEEREFIQIEWATSTKIIKKINLRVRTDNHTAIRLYKTKGFVKEGTIYKEIFWGGKYYDLLWMGLEL